MALRELRLSRNGCQFGILQFPLDEDTEERLAGIFETSLRRGKATLPGVGIVGIDPRPLCHADGGRRKNDVSVLVTRACISKRSSAFD